MSNLWFTSDTHYHHSNILKFTKRPYSSVQEMNESLVDNWNSVVKSKDTVYHLGDFAFPCKEQEAVNILKRLNGHKHFIRGNHDECIKREALKYFESFDHMKKLKVNNMFVVLCHFPLEAWENSYHGSMHIHGHTHKDLPTSQNMRRMEVSVDSCGMFPISFEEVYENLKDRPTNNF
jgi:calcineurin-like phosphoesterase family protein